ncbi:hypothetical protein MSG28_003944 [Choristoneura fumiferana]|uniref:Uncharacterized protein n=1 Tax=Choristoneura fumiferana TaxID=7141 RepID=A0ACC0KGU0_CHOFU|nr:hypothetical protein MSG28_003944 [Choristoneura fumiferana]
MSQWNNSYAYNQQYQGSGTWNGELGNQFSNQQFYPNAQPTYEPNNQYVNFQEFLSQMQGNNAAAGGSVAFNNAQYQNYPGNQYEYQTAPSPQNPNNYYPPHSNAVSAAEGYQTTAQSHDRNAPDSNYDNHMVFKSNLTPTATEFVPKGMSQVGQSGTVNTNPPDVSIAYNEVSESRRENNAESSWRGKQSSQPSSSRSYDEPKNEQEPKIKLDKESYSSHSYNENKSEQDPRKKPEKDRRRRNNESRNNINNVNNYRESNSQSNEHSGPNDPEGGDSESNSYRDGSRKQSSEYHSRNYDQNSRRNEPNGRNTRRNESSRQYEGSSRKYDNHNQNNESNNKNNDSDRNYDSNERNYSSRNNDSDTRQYDSSSRNYDSGGRNYDNRRRNYESNNRHYEGGNRNNDSNSRSYDASSRNNDSGPARSNTDYNRRGDFNGRDSDYNSRNNDYNNRNEDYNSRNYDSNNRNYETNRGQVKNSKLKNKEPDNRTFYNSSVNQSSQDVRSGRSDRGDSSARNRNWAGSQRVRPTERTDDEQYAKGYLDNQEDRYSRGSRAEAMFSPSRNRHRQVDQGGNSDLTQRERLSEQLDKGTLECLVCCERVRQTDAVWACGNCYHVLHLRCIRKWAMSSIIEGKWRCPACQNTSDEIPSEYRCMCGAVRAPDYQRGAGGAHTCGQACQRARSCPHPCSLPCHPGPCPPCQATVTRKCGCGAETRSVVCSSKLAQLCGRVCERRLACAAHRCAQPCHEGPCEPCTSTVDQVCHCPAAKSRSVPCTAESGGTTSWSCGAECSRVLACGAHVCREPCHAPPCAACRLLPAAVPSCPCGRTKLDPEARKACTDPVPLCGNICAKPLPCGPAGDKHFCKLDCHEGPCPVCPDKTLLPCRCGHSSREVPCAELPQMLDNVFCQKKCNKKLSCGRHRCRASCCAATSHRCGVVCGRLLACQLHRCEQFCHTGHCAPCTRASFEELTCECGAEVILPPVPCGAKRPACSAPCRRPRACPHPPHHACHEGDCPPCVVLTAKRCHGQHEVFKKFRNLLQEEFFAGCHAGNLCLRKAHAKICHKGPCDAGNCGHPCAAPCHAGAEGRAGGAGRRAAPARRRAASWCAPRARAAAAPPTAPAPTTRGTSPK